MLSISLLKRSLQNVEQDRKLKKVKGKMREKESGCLYGSKLTLRSLSMLFQLSLSL